MKTIFIFIVFSFGLYLAAIGEYEGAGTCGILVFMLVMSEMMRYSSYNNSLRESIKNIK